MTPRPPLLAPASTSRRYGVLGDVHFIARRLLTVLREEGS